MLLTSLICFPLLISLVSLLSISVIVDFLVSLFFLSFILFFPQLFRFSIPALTYSGRFAMVNILFSFLIPVFLVFSDFSMIFSFDSGSGIAGVLNLPVNFPPPYSVEQLTSKDSACKNIRRFTALPTHPSALPVSISHHSRNNAAGTWRKPWKIWKRGFGMVRISVWPVLK